ncbi:MAG: pseudouridine synthase [Pseudomonadota bacterium]
MSENTVYAEHNKRMIIDEDGHGTRLDQAIAPLFPEMGVRGRRRLWEHSLVTVNGRARPCGFCVSLGDVVAVQEKEASMVVQGGQSMHNAAIQHIDIIHVDTALGIAAVAKPSGLHSAAIAGSPLASVEALLPSLDFCEERAFACPQGFPKLLNRLDGPTSGMLLVALNNAGLDLWTQAEELGNIEKRYFAVACGTIDKSQTVKTALDTANRQVTKIRDYETADTLRHTEVIPLATFHASVQNSTKNNDKTALDLRSQAMTLVQCRIHKGARHQIRAHMASIGHPLLGDTVYGELMASDMHSCTDAQLFLHHGHVHITDFTAHCLPPWLSFLPPSIQEYVHPA